MHERTAPRLGWRGIAMAVTVTVTAIGAVAFPDAAIAALSLPQAVEDPTPPAAAPPEPAAEEPPGASPAYGAPGTCAALNRRPVALPGNIQPEISLDSEVDQPWHPRHGAIRFWVRGWPRALAQSPPVVCFRWNADAPRNVRPGDKTYAWMRSQVRSRIIRNDAEGILVEAFVGNLREAPPRKPLLETLFGAPARDETADTPAYGLYTALHLVPTARMVITLGDSGLDGDPRDDLFYRAEFDIGVTSVQAATGLTIAIGSLFLLALSRIRLLRNPSLNSVGVVLRLITTPDGRASLSQFQILVWSFVVGCGTVYVMCLTGNLINITTGTLILLGISGSTSLSADLRNRQITQAAIEANRPPPRWSQPAWADILTNHEGTEIDASRVQMLFFTLIATSYSIPDIPEGFLALMGISNGVFVTSAFIQPNPRTDTPGGQKPQPAAKA